MNQDSESICAICCAQLPAAQQYWPIHATVAKWLREYDARHAQLLATVPATLAAKPTDAADAAELLALIVHAFRELPRPKGAESPF